MRGQSAAKAVIRETTRCFLGDAAGLPGKCLQLFIQRCVRDVVRVVAQRLHGNADEHLEHLLPAVPSAQKPVEIRGLDPPSLIDDLRRKRPQRLELGIRKRPPVPDGLDLIISESRHLQTGAMGRHAVLAPVLGTRRHQHDLAFHRRQ